MTLRPVEFEIDGTHDPHRVGQEVRIVLRRGLNGERWSVSCRSWVLNRNGEWNRSLRRAPKASTLAGDSIHRKRR